MIRWDVSKADFALINKIVDRAITENPDLTISKVDLHMDIEAVHLNGCPLKLEKLLNADLGNFGHDVFGIQRYIDRRTGKLTNHFLPRYYDSAAAKKASLKAHFADQKKPAPAKMTCGLCKFTPKGKRDMDRHVKEIHKLTWEQYGQACAAVSPALRQLNRVNAAIISSGLRKSGLLALVFAVLALNGCTQYKRLIGVEPYEEDVPVCSNIGAQDFSGTDADVMDQLTFDQKNRLDNTAQFFDGREGALETVRGLYLGTLQFPAEPAGFACLDTAEFTRVVDAAVNLGRLPAGVKQP